MKMIVLKDYTDTDFAIAVDKIIYITTWKEGTEIELIENNFIR